MNEWLNLNEWISDEIKTDTHDKYTRCGSFNHDNYPNESMNE